MESKYLCTYWECQEGQAEWSPEVRQPGSHTGQGWGAGCTPGREGKRWGTERQPIHLGYPGLHRCWKKENKRLKRDLTEKGTDCIPGQMERRSLKKALNVSSHSKPEYGMSKFSTCFYIYLLRYPTAYFHNPFCISCDDGSYLSTSQLKAIFDIGNKKSSLQIIQSFFGIVF